MAAVAATASRRSRRAAAGGAFRGAFDAAMRSVWRMAADVGKALAARDVAAAALVDRRPLLSFGRLSTADAAVASAGGAPFGVECMSDADLGGQTRASWTLLDGPDRDGPAEEGAAEEGAGPGIGERRTASVLAPGDKFGRFAGDLSLTVTGTRMVRSGYAAVMASDARSRWDCEEFDAFALRVRTDGRVYVLNVAADGMLQDNLLWQAAIRTPPGRWTHVVVPFSRFVLTSHGRVLDAGGRSPTAFRYLLRLGVLMCERREGPFCFDLARWDAVHTGLYVVPGTRGRRFDGQMPGYSVSQLMTDPSAQ